MAGLQGVGKSRVAESLARESQAVLLSVDVIESALIRTEIERSFGSGLAAYIVAEDLAGENLRVGRDVIVDAANYVQVARDGWIALARREKTPLVFVDCVCSDFAEHRRRIEGRVRDLPGLPEVTWRDVIERYADVQPWGAEPRILVDTTDDIDPAALLRRIHDYVGR